MGILELRKPREQEALALVYFAIGFYLTEVGMVRYLLHLVQGYQSWRLHLRTVALVGDL